MTYDDIVAVFFAPPAASVQPPTLPGTPARRLRDALEPIATQGWWGRPPNDRLAALGLGFLDGYVWSRAAALGEPAPAVVVAAFGVFEPGLISAVYEQGRATAARDDVLQAREEGAVETLTGLVEADDAAAIADPLLAALGLLDGMARPLFSALRELPLPSSPQGRLWRAAELVREHRGDGHLAAAVSAGFEVVELNVLTELWLGFGLGEYSGTRGFGPDVIAAASDRLERAGLVAAGALTTDGLAARLALEDATDRSQHALIAALGSSVDAIVAASEAVSGALVDAGTFPPDPRKRAGG